MTRYSLNKDPIHLKEMQRFYDAIFTWARLHHSRTTITKEEIEKMKKDAEANADADTKAKETADKLNSADAMIFQTEKQLKEFGDKLSEDKKKPIEDALDELKKAYETKDIAVIDPALEKINEAWKSASEEMYKAQQAQQGDSSNSEKSEGSDEQSNDDVEDVDFEEVKE